jgi:lipoprotein signal peptidase
MPPIRSFRWLLLTLAILALSLDLGSKYGVFRWLDHGGQPKRDGAFEAWVSVKAWNDDKEIPMLLGGRYNVVPGWFGLTAEYNPASKPTDSGVLASLQTWSAPYLPRVNHGALFGLGNTHEDRANAVFAGVSLLAAIAILYYCGMKKANTHDRWFCVCLGLILGGTLGNFYDRIVFGGVRDFLYFYHPLPIFGDWPVFNFADCCLMVGAVMLVVQALFVPAKAKAATTSTAMPGIPVAMR